MTIRQQWPWPLRLALTAALLLLLLLLGWGLYSLGRGGIGNVRTVTSLEQQMAQLGKEREKLLSEANAYESKLNIERAAQQQWMKQAKTLELENSRLKEDLAFFESLIPADIGQRGIAIRRIKVDAAAGNQLRYRVLVMQGGKGDLEFNGALQLVVNGQQAGKSVTLQFPDPRVAASEQYKVSFKHYQRLEGSISLPDGVQAKTVQARVLERGQVRAQQSANL
jgi:hypothetical protein